MLFIADPFPGLDPTHDSTVAMIEAAQRAGHEVWGCTVVDLGVGDRGADALVTELNVTPARIEGGRWVADPHWLLVSEPQRRPLDDFAVISMRTDPPVDEAYLRATHLLDLVDRRRTVVVNRPSGLRDANEKLYGLRHPELMPETVVSADRQRLCGFVSRLGLAVAKPTGGMAGRGILLLRDGDPNVVSMLDILTERGRSQIVVQAYVPEVEHGDRRIILIDGCAVGAVTRIAAGGDFRCNMAAGGAVRVDHVDDVADRIARSIGPSLRRDGLWFVGLDVIGDRLTEVNVTSPTGIREIQLLSGVDVAARYVELLVEIHARETESVHA